MSVTVISLARMSATVIMYTCGMSRWKPDARSRLQQSALEIYRERGYEQATVVEIAQRAGLTERTFFRHFADKREVLFVGADELREILVGRVAIEPVGTAPFDTVAAAVETLAASSTFQPEGRDKARQRQAVIAANPALQERELIKLASLSAALADALRVRGVGEPAASLAAEAGIVVFRVAFDRWVVDDEGRGLSHFVQESLSTLRAATAPS